jgi:V8-like Glu-specific endopeptidase
MRRVAVLLFVSMTAFSAGVYSDIAPSEARQSAEPTAPASVTGNQSWRPEVSGAESASSYWTNARLRAAQPFPLPVLPGGPPVSATESGPLESGPVSRPYTNARSRAIGKVFFTGADGNDYSCSGTVVRTARNESVVWTAGHCVYSHESGGWHSNWVFIPAYSSSFPGQRPYGTWEADILWTRTFWIDTGSWRQDIGAAVVEHAASGASIVDRVGGHRIGFDAAQRQDYLAVGYPHYEGTDQRKCSSPLGGRDTDTAGSLGPAPMYITCDLQPGSSGGPWLRSIDEGGIGTIASVNSYRYRGTPQRMYGPYLGGEARSLFNTAQSDGLPPGPANLLVNPEFEDGSSPWQPFNLADQVNYATYSGNAFLNSHYEQMNVSSWGASFGQDVGRATSVGQRYQLSLQLRMPGRCGRVWRGTLAIWALGGTAESATTPFVIHSCEGWTSVATTLRIARSGHGVLRSVIYGRTVGGVNVDLDAARLIER